MHPPPLLPPPRQMQQKNQIDLWHHSLVNFKILIERVYYFSIKLFFLENSPKINFPPKLLAFKTSKLFIDVLVTSSQM